MGPFLYAHRHTDKRKHIDTYRQIDTCNSWRKLCLYNRQTDRFQRTDGSVSLSFVNTSGSARALCEGLENVAYPVLPKAD